MDEWYTLDRAASHLGVSPRTLRRWIKAGKLDARLEPGPYGQQYVVLRSSLAGVQVVRDVERAERQADREAVPRIVEDYVSRRESAVAQEIAQLRAAVQAVQERQDALVRQLDRIEAMLAGMSAEKRP